MEIAPIDLDGCAEESSLFRDTEWTLGVARSGAYNDTECLEFHSVLTYNANVAHPDKLSSG